VLTEFNSDAPTPATGPVPPAAGGLLIDEIVRYGARRMLAAALEAEVAAYMAGHLAEVDDNGRRLVVRNGDAQGRSASWALDRGCPRR